jgi:hypothetical protein
MAWFAIDLDGTLVNKMQDQDVGMDVPTDGAVEAMQTLANEGHRLTVFTSRFNVMPDTEKRRLKEQIEQQLQEMGFPEMEVWTGTTKPSADIFIDNNAITFDNDWGLALAQTQVMLEERGLTQGPMPGAAEQTPPQEEQEPSNEIPQEASGG